MLDTMSEPTASPLAPRELPDYLISKGRYWITVEEAMQLLGLSRTSALSALRRLNDADRLFSPAQGLYVVIPPEYRRWGVVPANWFVDPLMAHLDAPYYVGLLSAASVHGASHQAPQVFQIISPKRVLDRDIERVRLRFYRHAHFESRETEQKVVHTGYMTVSTRETTVVDLVTWPGRSGGLSNVATVLVEIGGLDTSKLARLCRPLGYSTARRLGWLLDEFRDDVNLAPLQEAAELGRGEPVPLHAAAGRKGRADKRWQVRINTDVEPDV